MGDVVTLQRPALVFTWDGAEPRTAHDFGTYRGRQVSGVHVAVESLAVLGFDPTERDFLTHCAYEAGLCEVLPEIGVSVPVVFADIHFGEDAPDGDVGRRDRLLAAAEGWALKHPNQSNAYEHI